MLRSVNYLEAGKICLEQQNSRNAADSRGCMVLNHDTPSELAYRNDYNTTDDIVASLNRASFGGAFASPASAKTIALCFKLPFLTPCELLHPDKISNEASVQNWLSLTDEFLFNVSQAVHTHNLSLRVLLDGGSNPGQYPCLANRWRPLQSMYISGRDPNAAFTSNNRTLGWDRLVVLNEDQTHWEFAVDNAFGKFANLSNPYLVWEPSDEATIQSDAKLYLSSLHQNPAGMRFATNLDPAQLLTYSGRESGQAWNTDVPNLDTVSSRVLASHFSGTHNGDNLFLAWAASGGLQVAVLNMNASARPASSALQTVFQQAVPSVTLDSNTSLVEVGAVSFRPDMRALAGTAQVCAQASVYTLGQLQAKTVLTVHEVAACATGSGQSRSVWNASLPANSSAVAVSSVPCPQLLPGAAAAGCTLVVFAASFASTDAPCGIQGMVIGVNGQLQSPVQCLTALLAASSGSISTLQVTVVGESSVLLLASATDKNVYGATIALDALVSPQGGALAPHTMAWVYAGSSVSSAAFAGGATAVFQDGFCPNNEPSNKAAWPSSCHQTPISQTEVLTYAHASSAAWQSSIASAAKQPPAGEPPAVWACSALYDPAHMPVSDAGQVSAPPPLRGEGGGRSGGSGPILGPDDAPYPGQAMSHCSAEHSVGAFSQGRHAVVVCSAAQCWALARLPASSCARCGPALTGDSWRLYGWQ